MGDTARLLVLVAVGVAAYGGWRLYSYPGGWSYAFGREYAEDRKDLEAAREGVRVLTRELKQELSGAHARVGREKRRHRQAVRSAERKIESLRRPGPGQEVERFGGLTLHEHTVRKGEQDFALAGLQVRLEVAQHQCFVHLTEPDGDACHVPFSRTDHAEDDVRHFVLRLERAVADEAVFRSRAAVSVARAEDELARVRADTHAEDEARHHLAAITERHDQDPRRQAAHAELSSAYARWTTLTGTRPR